MSLVVSCPVYPKPMDPYSAFSDSDSGLFFNVLTEEKCDHSEYIQVAHNTTQAMNVCFNWTYKWNQSHNLSISAVMTQITQGSLTIVYQ